MPDTFEDGRLLVWGSDVEQGTIDQAAKAARLPIVAGHVALMPDAHVGMGATVGSVIPTKGAVIPAAVGVDIGCGMIAAELDLRAGQLPDSLDPLVRVMDWYIPSGVGKGHDKPLASWGQWYRQHEVTTSQAAALLSTAGKQFGTLGSGNHFAEVCLDETDQVWLVLHSGSRGIGNKLATQHVDQAKAIHAILGTELEEKDLAWLEEGWPSFHLYIKDMLWCQDYALGNRETIMRSFLRALENTLDHDVDVKQSINCHHNYTAREWINYGGETAWVTRKGAIDAHPGALGVIPGSMGTRSYIVEGLGNERSHNSCSHGAGRRMSRKRARNELDVVSFEIQMAGVAWQKNNAKTLLDEAPGAYKDIDQVMEDQKDLVVVRHTLHQVANYKGF